AQFVFFDKQSTGVNIVLTPDGSNLTAPITGVTNIELFTSRPGSLAPGYQGSAFLFGGTVNGATVTGGNSLALLDGDYGVRETQGNTTIALGTGDQTVIGAAGDTIIPGPGPSHVGDNTLVRLGDGPTTVTGGVGDTIVAAAGNAQIDGSAGRTLIK